MYPQDNDKWPPRVVTKLVNPMGWCCLIEDNYGKSVAKIARLLAQARVDFPALVATDLQDGEVDVVILAESPYTGMLAIEFQMPDGFDAPADYIRVKNLPRAC